MFDAVKVKNDCVNWIREFFRENGPDCNAVLGIEIVNREGYIK